MTSDMTTAAAPPQASALNLIKRLIKTYLAPYKLQVITAIAFMIVCAATTAALAWLMKPVMDEVLGGNRAMIIPVALAVFFTFFIQKFFPN